MQARTRKKASRPPPSPPPALATPRLLRTTAGDSSGEGPYLLSSLAVQDLLDLLKAEDGVLNPEEERALPVDRARHRGLALAQRRVVEVLDEDFVDDVDLKKRQVCPVSRDRPRVSRQRCNLRSVPLTT